MPNEDTPSKDPFANIKEQELIEKIATFDKMVNLGLLAMGIAHEINNAVNYVFTSITPLKSSVNNVIEILKKYEEITESSNLKEKLKEIDELKKEINLEETLEDIHTMLAALTEGARRTTHIVKDLQNYSRSSSSTEKESVSINACIDSSLTLLVNRYKDRIEIIKSYSDMPLIPAYSRKISQVFMNILINAIQAIQGKGKIYITTKIEDQEALISIKDTGIGMDENVRSKIFELFFTTNSVDGTGLGMPISLKIVEEHHGKLSVNSKLGEGTEFVIRLPVA